MTKKQILQRKKKTYRERKGKTNKRKVYYRKRKSQIEKEMDRQ